MTIIDISKILFFISIIIWIIPPFRQYKGAFFDYFLVLAFIDPIALVYGLLTKSNLPLWVTVLFGYLLIISITSEELLKKLKYFFIILPLLFIVFIPTLNSKIYFILIIGENILLIFVFLKGLITGYTESKKIDWFYLLLVFYVFTIIFKIFNLIIGFADATAFYIITSIAQIFFGLFFSIIRKDRPQVVA